MWPFKKKPNKVIDQKSLNDILRQELSPYLKKVELQKYLADIERDKQKKKLWDSLSARKKIRLMRYVLEKKGELDGQKR